MMMADLATPRMTVDEFLVWAEGQDGRWELQDGAPVSMSPERVAHTETKGEAYSALKNAIAVARAPCRALTEGAAMGIDAGTVFEPDVFWSTAGHVCRRRRWRFPALSSL